jgi:choline dehydrogenase-like flavoprotein
MQVHRGQKDDYDRWGSYFGQPSQWSWDGLLPYFKKVSRKASCISIVLNVPGIFLE